MESLQHVVTKYDELAMQYDRRYAGEEGSPAFKLFLGLYDQLTWRYIEPYLPQDKAMPILDAGGGTGKWAARIAALGHQDVRVLDLSEQMLDQAQTRFADQGLESVLTTKVGDIRALPWPQDTFGFVLSEGDPVGYCLSDYTLAISELVRVCAPGGTIVIAVDNLLPYYLGTFRGAGLEAARELARTRTVQCPYGLPVRCFTPRELRQTFDAAGADVTEILAKPALIDVLDQETFTRFTQQDPQPLFEVENWACEEGYTTSGSHLQVVARKRS